ncbi:hypothetical protein ACJZRZ_000963 [Vibrio parahaemolyticus]
MNHNVEFVYLANDALTLRSHDPYKAIGTYKDNKFIPVNEKIKALIEAGVNFKIGRTNTKVLALHLDDAYGGGDINESQPVKINETQQNYDTNLQQVSTQRKTPEEAMMAMYISAAQGHAPEVVQNTRMNSYLHALYNPDMVALAAGAPRKFV